MKNNRLIYLGASALLLPLLILVIPWYPWQLIAGLILMAFLPGYALLKALWPQSGCLRPSEEWLIAAPVSYSLTITLLLVMAFAGLRLTTLPVALGLGGITLLFTLIAWRRQLQHGPIPDHRSDVPIRPFAHSLILLLLLAACFRMVNIHYSDYQGDEADILLRAVSLVYGQVDALLTHSKGPGEILLLNAIGALTGRFDEQTARLPFALAGTVSVGFIVLLGQVLFNRWVGLTAGLLVAIDGVFVSYARTAQYQSVVLLLILAAIYAYYRFQQRGDLSRRWHGLATFLLAGSFLFHFEVVLLLPVVVYLTFAGKTRGGEDTRTRGRGDARTRGDEETSSASPPHRLIAPRLTYHVSRIWPSILIFVVPVALFYAPFLLNPNLQSTGTYLENRIGGGSSPPFNNLAHFFYFEALKYNSAYYVVLFNGLLLLTVAALLAGGRGRRGAREKSFLQSFIALPLILLIVSGAALWWLGQTQIAAWLLAGGTALFFGWTIFSPQISLPQRALWLWLAPSFWVYVFLVSRPGKHHYLFLGALALWVGWGVIQGRQWAAATWPKLGRPAGRWVGAGLVVVVALVVFAGHTVMLFLRSDLEYVLTYPDHRSAFYPTDATYPYGTRIGFGYPFRLGWQLVGQLRRTGQLEGSWAGNDDGNAPIWYMLGARSTPCYPHYVLQGEVTYKGDDDFKVPFDPANFGYAPRYRIWGSNRLRLTILEFQPLRPVEAVDLTEPAYFSPPVTPADFALALTGQPSPPQVALQPALVLGEGSELKNSAPPEYLARAGQLSGRVALLGYDAAEEYAQPGSIVPVTLHWQAQSRLSLRYKVFVHLIAADGQNWGQADDFPVCGTSHANAWETGKIILDRHLLKLPPDLLPGSYTLMVGMYEPDLNLRLNYFDVAGNEQGNSLTIGKLQIRE